MAIRRRIDKSRYKFGTSSRRRTHTNGSCVMATSSEVVLAVTFRKNVGGSTSIDQLSQEMKPFTENVERWGCASWSPPPLDWYSVFTRKDTDRYLLFQNQRFHWIQWFHWMNVQWRRLFVCVLIGPRVRLAAALFGRLYYQCMWKEIMNGDWPRPEA